jgi:hypothetical protein
VPKTADHAASRTFHTWRVDDAAVHARVAAEVALAACNLRARLQHEYRQHAEVRACIHAQTLCTWEQALYLSHAPAVTVLASLSVRAQRKWNCRTSSYLLVPS